ncbi:MAG TPA: glyceraldehyde 3-phosphate dehydrogenase NAD-binding domain-containing protein, partial [Candidatus Krumholzibacteria bacterium]
MTCRIGIMGFGRIGRNIFRILHQDRDLQVAAIVDTAAPEALEYLLRFDTVHGRFSNVALEDGVFYSD